MSAVSHLEVTVRDQANLCEIHGGERALGQSFLLKL